MRFIGIFIGIGFGVGLFAALTSLNLSLRMIVEHWQRIVRRDSDFAHHLAVGVAAAAISIVFFTLLGKSVAHVILLTGLVTFGAIGLSHNKMNTDRQKSDFALSLTTPAWLDVLSLCLYAGLPIRLAMSRSLQSASSLQQSAWQTFQDSAKFETSMSSQLLEVASRRDAHSKVANSLLVAIERGTPLANVISSLSQELRSEHRRRLLEIAARKEVVMMIPVIFGILPSVTAIALYPAFSTLSSLH
jgi:tight adherence protein C